ncbi:hypothetical protein HID58_044821 [Brassica napus]|uniref:Uncharacterized protein n=1 Tax=Brassica napus TaxID=3708 RepID=A0ABQ8BLU4_BRANA|nr:hypothetical protein HID58_044821 [Brassica napus]
MAKAACSRFGIRLVKNVAESSPLYMYVQLLKWIIIPLLQLITEGQWEFLQLDDVTDEPSVNSSFAALKNWIRNIKQPASDDVEKILLPKSIGQALADKKGSQALSLQINLDYYIVRIRFASFRTCYFYG